MDRPLIKDGNLRTLRGGKRLRYIWDYYKFPLVLLCILLYIIGYAIYGKLTYKDTILYTAFVNAVAGEELTQKADGDFIEYLELDPSEVQLTLYTGLYLTDNELDAYHEYTYASRMKILAAIESKLLDVVLMNREAFDAFSQNGYLCNLDELLSRDAPAFYGRIRERLVDGILILEDNAEDRIFDSSVPYRAETLQYPMGLELSGAGIIGQAGFDGAVYAGIIANSPRTDTAIAYLEYLFSEGTDPLPGTQTQSAHRH